MYWEPIVALSMQVLALKRIEKTIRFIVETHFPFSFYVPFFFSVECKVGFCE